MTEDDTNLERADLRDRLRELEASLARRDAQIARLEHDLATTREEKAAVANRLLRQLDNILIAKSGQVAECLYHLGRINASPWWQLGKWLEKFAAVPGRIVSKLFESGRSTTDHSGLAGNYQKWIALYDSLSDRDRKEIERHLASLEYQPLLSLVMATQDVPELALRDTVASIRNQLYQNWELLIAGAGPTASAIVENDAANDPRIKWHSVGDGQSNFMLNLAKGAFVTFVESGDTLAEQALYEVVVELNHNRNADIVYSDEDRLDKDGRRHTAYFKTDWNPELFLGHNMIGHLFVVRRALLDKIDGFHGDRDLGGTYDLVLRTVSAAKSDQIRHIPAILYHARERHADKVEPAPQFEAVRQAKRAFLSAHNENAEVEANPFSATIDRVRRKLPVPAPLVSLIIPNRNRHDLLGACLEGLLNRTSYQPIEVIIVDHESNEEETLALLNRMSADKRIRIIRYQGPFNYSDMNNRAVAEARGEIIGLINNDIEVIAPDWLSEMVSLAALPENGVIGAKLLYPDDRLQHGGIMLGVPWGTEHVHKFVGRNDPGYFGRLVQTTNISAVTGACLVVRKRLFEEAGGLDAVNLAVAFSDVDLCLKIRARGHLNVWTPFALLYHHESVSRGNDTDADKVDRANRELDFMRCKWGYALDFDPYFNVNLSLQNPSFALAFPPRRIKPWRAAAIQRARDESLVAKMPLPDCHGRDQ